MKKNYGWTEIIFKLQQLLPCGAYHLRLWYRIKHLATLGAIIWTAPKLPYQPWPWIWVASRTTTPFGLCRDVVHRVGAAHWHSGSVLLARVTSNLRSSHCMADQPAWLDLSQSIVQMLHWQSCSEMCTNWSAQIGLTILVKMLFIFFTNCSLRPTCPGGCREWSVWCWFNFSWACQTWFLDVILLQALNQSSFALQVCTSALTPVSLLMSYVR